MYDVAIIGAGFGGAATAILLAKQGYKVVLIEKSQHPRFALGESANPLVGNMLRHLAQKYDIPEFVSLSGYDFIKEAGLPITCGPKELFHYFYHELGATSAKLHDGTVPELIVQTSAVDAQMLRSDSDAYLVEVAKDYGVDYFELMSVENIDFRDDGVTLNRQSESSGSAMQFNTQFVIDGTGHKSVISRDFDLKMPPEEMDIPLKSRCIFTHFKDIGKFEDCAECDQEFIDRVPASRVRSTQHHCFDGGWIWLIPFENGITSVGINLDIDRYPLNEKSGEEEFWEIVDRYPIVKKMLAGCETRLPYIKTGRIQFRTSQAADTRWAMLPASAVGGDAWFSTGLGHTLLCAGRLVEILDTKVLANNSYSREHFSHYEYALFKEWNYACRMTDAIYKSFKYFDVFKYYCFVFFMGTESFTHSEGIQRSHDPKFLMLNVGNELFVSKFEKIYGKVKELYNKDIVEESDLEYLRNIVNVEMNEFNRRDYGNDERNCLHPRVRPYQSPQEYREMIRQMKENA